MLDVLGRSPSTRKLRLFAVACCNLIRHLLHDPRSQDAVMVAERHADGMATDTELAAARAAAWAVVGSISERVSLTTAHAAWNITWQSAYGAAFGADYYTEGFIQGAERCAMMRHIIGNPFRSPIIESGWLTTSVIEMTEAIYSERAFDRLPLLADALEDAGCTDADILAHCRSPGPHVRGCWVVDLLTGRQ